MKKETLQQKIEQRAEERAVDEYRKFVEFMLKNELCKLLKFKKGDELVPFCGIYSQDPLFETGVRNEMKDTDNYTNFNEARKQLFEFFVEKETNELLQKIDSLSDYFNQHEE